jgi:SAM-dependent methyltransferase
MHKGAATANLRVGLPSNNLMPLPFATPKALALTRSLFREPPVNAGAGKANHSTGLGNGVIWATETPLPFDNTRIGNYHPDALAALDQPGVIALDIGCGIRDRVFDNLVTQDIYLTPTATLITAPGEARLPFDSATFDVIILDSVLEHVPDPVAMLQEGYRLLKPGGKILGDAPFLQPLHLLPHHYFNFTPFGLQQVAGKAGLNLEYVSAEAHQRPEFTLEWMFRRIFETVSPSEATRLKNMSVDSLYKHLVQNKNLIALPPESITEMAAGYRFHMVRPLQ